MKALRRFEAIDAADRQRAAIAFKANQRQSLLSQIIGAASSPRRFPRCLHCRQEQGGQDADDRDHDQQLHEREAARNEACVGTDGD